MILTCAFDINVFSDIFSVSIGTINLIFVVVFAIIEGRRIRKIEKHHDIVNLYEAFKLHDDTCSFVEAAESFKTSLLNLTTTASKQKFNANKAVDIKDDFIEKLYFFKDKFLNIVETVDQKRVREFTDNLNEIEDASVNLLNNVIGLKTKEDRIAAINSAISLIKKKIIEIGFQLSTF